MSIILYPNKKERRDLMLGLGVEQRFKKAITVTLVMFLITMLFPFAGFAEDTGGKLVAHYKFDGDFTDSTGNGHDGTNVGDVTFADKEAVFGKSASFNGGYITVPSAPELNLGSKFTISVWVKVNPDVKSNGAIISKLDDNGTYNNLYAYTRGKFGVRMDTRAAPGGEYSITNSAFSDYGMDVSWTHLVLSCDGQSLYLYKNGKLDATKSVKPSDSVIKPSENIMRIGNGDASSTQNSWFQGKMDDLRIYDYALSSTEIKALYDAAGTYQHKILLVLGKTKMTVDNVVKDIDPGRRTYPVIVEGRTLVPIRAIVESMGGTVGWNAGTQQIDITLKSKHLKLWVNKTTADLDGQQLTLDVPPKVMNGRTMVPLRFVGESLGCKVQWDGKTQTVTIQY